MSNDEKERAIYDMRSKILKDKVSALNRAKKEGKEEGREEGREEGMISARINIAKNLLDVLDNETIAIKTGLSIAEINELR